MSSKIAFFCEAGAKRGLGHVVRSYTIYKKFHSLGYEVRFFVDSDIDLSDRYEDINYFRWKDFTLDRRYDAIFIDSYEADISIYEMISRSTKVAVYLDDFKRLDYPKGIIINFSPDAREKFFAYKNPFNKYFLGLDYIPIREIFFQPSQEKRESLFIMLGGSDVLNLSYTISQCFKDIDMHKVVVTNSKESAKSIEKLYNTTVLYKPSDELLVRYMKQAKIAISTASMSLYELNFLSVPTAIIATSKDQLIGAKALEQAQLAEKYIDINKDDWRIDLRDSIYTIKRDRKEPLRLVDGLGADRIVDEVVRLLK